MVRQNKYNTYRITCKKNSLKKIYLQMTYFNDIYIKTIAFSINKDRQLLDYKTKYLHPLNMIISLFLTEIDCNPYISIKTDKNLIYSIQF